MFRSSKTTTDSTDPTGPAALTDRARTPRESSRSVLRACGGDTTRRRRAHGSATLADPLTLATTTEADTDADADVAALHELLTNLEIDPDHCRNPEGTTALGIVAYANRADAASILAASGASPLAVNVDSVCPLELAVFGNAVDALAVMLVACSAEIRAAAADASLADDEKLTQRDVSDAVADSLASASDEVRSLWQAWLHQRGHPALSAAQTMFLQQSQALAQVTERTRRSRLSRNTRRSASLAERHPPLPSHDYDAALEVLRRCVENIDARLALIEGQLACLRAQSDGTTSHTAPLAQCIPHTPPARPARPSAVSDAVVRRAARRLPQNRVLLPEWLSRMRAIGHHLHLTRPSAATASAN